MNLNMEEETAGHRSGEEYFRKKKKEELRPLGGKEFDIFEENILV